MEELLQSYVRGQSISWWRTMNFDEQAIEVEKWKQMTNSDKKRWQHVMIAHSSSTIERIYRELVLGENFDN